MTVRETADPTTDGPGGPLRTTAGDTQARRTTPVKWWAAFGAFCFLATAYTWTAWLLAGAAKPAPKGDVPLSMKIGLHLLEAGLAAVSLVVAYHYLVKPWRRDGRLSWDGMFLLTLPPLWMLQDPMINYTRPWFAFNSELLNLGCPQCYLPGWQSSARNMAEPPIFVIGMYVAGFFMGMVACNAVMRAAKRRWPKLGTIGLVGVAVAFCALADLIFEGGLVRTGAYTFGGSIHGLTLFQGETYQFPVYEMFLFGIPWAAFACLRYFRNDRGESLVERGVNRIRAGHRQRMGLRYLAVVGGIQFILLFYTVFAQWFGAHADSYPQGIIDHTYYNNGICGAGSQYACPDDRLPVTTGPESAYFDLGGRPVTPMGVPVQVP